MIAIFGGGEIAEKGIVPVIGGSIVTAAECDVTQPDTVAKVMDALHPNAVIFTAGISNVTTVADSDPDDWARELATNLLGAYHVAQAAIAIRARTMIFVASVAGLYGKPNHSAYSASKGGVISLVQSLAMEGHDAYAISPGRVDTAMREKDYPGEDPRTRLQPAQVGQVVAQILGGEFEAGDNIIIRKIGYDTFQRTDKGEPWRSYLAVGQPPVF